MKPITEKEIPVHSSEELDKLRESELGIPCKADGYPGRIFIRAEGEFGSDEKVVILFDQEHPTFEKFFVTKYFIIEPGKLNFGEKGLIEIMHP